MTWLVNRYIAMEAHIDLHRVGNRLEGQLTDSPAAPWLTRAIDIAAEQTGRTGAPSVHSRSGYVPTNAVRALFALRINTECGCAGQANVAIGPMQYHEDTYWPNCATDVPPGSRAWGCWDCPLPRPDRPIDHAKHSNFSCYGRCAFHGTRANDHRPWLCRQRLRLTQLPGREGQRDRTPATGVPGRRAIHWCRDN